MTIHQFIINLRDKYHLHWSDTWIKETIAGRKCRLDGRTARLKDIVQFPIKSLVLFEWNKEEGKLESITLW